MMVRAMRKIKSSIRMNNGGRDLLFPWWSGKASWRRWYLNWLLSGEKVIATRLKEIYHWVRKNHFAQTVEQDSPWICWYFFFAASILFQFWRMYNFNFSLVFGGNKGNAATVEPKNLKAHWILTNFTVKEPEAPKDYFFQGPLLRNRSNKNLDSQYNPLERTLKCTASPSLFDHTNCLIGALWKVD